MTMMTNLTIRRQLKKTQVLYFYHKEEIRGFCAIMLFQEQHFQKSYFANCFFFKVFWSL